MKMVRKLSFVALIILGAFGCQTGYQSSHGSITGGFSDKQLSYNTFYVKFSGNGYTSGTRAYDLALTRCSELCLENGFNYYIILRESNLIDRSTGVYSSTYIPTGYGGGVSVGSVTQIPKPESGITVSCFVDNPNFSHLTGECFNARKQIFRAEKTHSIKVEAHEKSFDFLQFEKETLDVIEKSVEENYDFNSSDSNVTIFFNDSLKDLKPGITHFTTWSSIDNPYVKDQQRLRSFVLDTAKKIGANIVMITDKDKLFLDQKKEVSPNVIPNLMISFARKTPALGVIFEPKLLEDKIFVVRDFSNYSPSKDSGLKYGDKILRVDDNDVLNGKAFNFIGKHHNDQVNLRVIRNGEEIFINTKLRNYWN